MNEATPGDRLRNVRVLMYSHDTFGLGHLRRCRTIAHALVDRFKGVTVLIISGSQIAGAFEFKARVDFVKIPSVIKLYDGDYASMSEHIDLADTLALRAALVKQTAKRFRPDIFIVDKEPMGLRGEIEPTLRWLKRHGVPCVLGLRDVMDEPQALAREWARRDVLAKAARFYDEVWAYGPRDFHDPLGGLDLPDGLAGRMRYTGFLRREAPEDAPMPDGWTPDSVVVTAGGGGDGATLMAHVLSACEADPTLRTPYLLVTGPFMPSEAREAVRRRAERLANVTVIDFDAGMEAIVAASAGLVGMCGYNTFCEVLSFDKPALFLPRTRPRAEQAIRAGRAEELGYAQMLDVDEAEDPARMAAALHALARQPKPSAALASDALDGLETVCRRVAELTS